MTRRFAVSDWPEWIRMRQALWPDSDENDARAWLLRTDVVTVVTERSVGYGLAGFAEAGERAYADGCDSSPVAFLEGWYVDPDQRRLGVGTALVAAVEAWAGKRGLSELASDSLLGDDEAYAAHCKVGFEEIERCVKYRKSLQQG